MTKTLFILIGIVIIIGVVIGLTRENSQDRSKEVVRNNAAGTAGENDVTGEVAKNEKKRDKAPALSLKDYNGNTVNLSDFSGTPMIVNSWAAWCPFCREELPDLAKLQKEFGQEIIVIAIDRAESLKTAKRYSDELNVTNELIFLLDPKDLFYQSIGGFSMPETVFVDAQGNIADHKRGFMTFEEMRLKTIKAFGL